MNNMRETVFILKLYHLYDEELFADLYVFSDYSECMHFLQGFDENMIEIRWELFYIPAEDLVFLESGLEGVII